METETELFSQNTFRFESYYMQCDFYTPGSGEHGNPVFNRGSGGGARGCGFEERVGVYARTEGGHFL